MKLYEIFLCFLTLIIQVKPIEYCADLINNTGKNLTLMIYNENGRGWRVIPEESSGGMGYDGEFSVAIYSTDMYGNIEDVWLSQPQKTVNANCTTALWTYNITNETEHVPAGLTTIFENPNLSSSDCRCFFRQWTTFAVCTIAIALYIPLFCD
jgi:hypothetical protein